MPKINDLPNVEYCVSKSHNKPLHSKCGLWSAAWASPGSLLKMQHLGLHARSTEAEPAFEQDPQVLSRLMKGGGTLR